MKIIDNKKDYYDYLSEMYGIDDLIVFDRRISKMLNSEKGMEACFCMDKISSDKPLVAKRKWELDSIVKRKEMAKAKKYNYRKTSLEGNVYHYILETGLNQYYIEVERWIIPDKPNDVVVEYRLILTKNDIKNRISDSPVCIIPCQSHFVWWSEDIEWKHEKDSSKWIVNPILMHTYIPKLIPPEEIWKAIYEYLSSQKDKPIIDKRNDIQKLESAGFDKRTSFRNIN